MTYKMLWNIGVSETHIAEIQDGRVAVCAERPQISSISLGFGSGARRPITSSVLGIGFIYLGLFPIQPLFLSIINGTASIPSEPKSAKLIGLVLALTAFMWVIGIYLLHDAIRRKYFLAVATEKAVFKLFINKSKDGLKIRDLVKKIEVESGIKIEILHNALI